MGSPRLAALCGALALIATACSDGTTTTTTTTTTQPPPLVTTTTPAPTEALPLSAYLAELYVLDGDVVAGALDASLGADAVNGLIATAAVYLEAVERLQRLAPPVEAEVLHEAKLGLYEEQRKRTT